MQKVENPACKHSKQQRGKEINIVCKADKSGLYMEKGRTRSPKPDPCL